MVGMELSGSSSKAVTARALGLVVCRNCTKVHRLGEAETCARCGQRLLSRDTKSLQRVWAWWLLGLICYIPANMYPMLQTRTLLKVQEDTIVGGAVELIHHGSYGIAAIILIASVAIPIGKFAAVALVAISVVRPSSLSGAKLRFVHEVVEYVGRWSMIDIFVVAILSSLVQLNSLAAVQPGQASLFFALSVVFTMLSAQAFDTRLIWDTRLQDDTA
ncbi:paraquat-inducible protein A [Alphaproteobacteria bacterium KMM 3653]|uniref:Paraquat-inducible protein A n=1 Tax=Harenicola maris TaxID=2841044 RepID=A0AAP2CRZ6_9RHOB|nr:paraquat-inducible protein A [Harenicola maris]